MKALFKLKLCLLVALICISCENSKHEQPTRITGNWYYANSDSMKERSNSFSYGEVYINETRIAFMDQGLGPIDYDYTLSTDSIYLYHKGKMEGKGKYYLNDKDQLVFSFHKGELINKYNKIYEPYDFFSIRDRDTEEAYYEILHEYNLREMRYSHSVELNGQ